MIRILSAAAGLLVGAALATPGFAQPAESQSIEAAQAHFEQAFAETCFWNADIYPDEFDVELWDLTWESQYSDTPYATTLIQFFCGAGAYNVSSVFYLIDSYDGPFPIAFAVPHFDVKYENDDLDGAVEAIPVLGMTTQWRLTNAHFDPESNTITSNAYWRGLGDASSIGVWQFHEGEFVLKTYDVDASYDGEINHERIMEFK